MRMVTLLLFAALGCAADPVLLPDAGPCSSACGAGTTCVAGACVAIDAGGGDVPATDVPCEPRVEGCICGDGRSGTRQVCASEWCECGPLPDAGRDVLDATEDRPAPMDVTDVPRADVGADVPSDDGIFRPDRTAPMDDAGRLLCGAGRGQACTTNADCARCAPPAGVQYPWCCAGDGPGLMECTVSSVACVGP